MADDESPDDARRRRRHAQRMARKTRRWRALVAVVVAAVAVGISVAVVTAGGRNAGSAAGVATRATTDLTASGARPRATPGAAASRRRSAPVPVPILMYHVIAPPFASSPYPGLYVPPQEFVAQMLALKRAGFHAVTLDEVRHDWLTGAPLPSHPVVLSFDNGYHSQYTVAFRVLRRLGWVGVENLQLTGLPLSQGGLSRRQVRRLVAAGWELDTQGFSHADLVSLDPTQLRYQVAVARRVMHRLYGAAIDWFCYPSGYYDDSVVAEVRAAGYVGATTVVPGLARSSDDVYRLPRLRVLGGTTPAGLLTMIAEARYAAPGPNAYPG
jgi:peptidoglycan/xylan/chitin deacetylase (PgdA/CDA1 family)